MFYKIAGIDVHKKVLMVVVMDASTPESKPERRRFATMPSDLGRVYQPDMQKLLPSRCWSGDERLQDV